MNEIVIQLVGAIRSPMLLPLLFDVAVTIAIAVDDNNNDNNAADDDDGVRS